MALEALKKYAQEQNQATQEEIERLTKNERHRSPTRHENKPSHIKPLASKENVTEALQERLAGMYKVPQENITKAGQLRAEINKGIQSGEPIYRVLLKAIECISLMTGEKLFYEMNKEHLQTIYGILGETQAIEIECEEVQSRLSKLKEAFEGEIDPGDRQRIKRAIRSHEEKLNSLQ